MARRLVAARAARPLSPAPRTSRRLRRDGGQDALGRLRGARRRGRLRRRPAGDSGARSRPARPRAAGRRASVSHRPPPPLPGLVAHPRASPARVHPSQTIGPDANGVKTVIEYVQKEDGGKVRARSLREPAPNPKKPRQEAGAPRVKISRRVVSRAPPRPRRLAPRPLLTPPFAPPSSRSFARSSSSARRGPGRTSRRRR